MLLEHTYRYCYIPFPVSDYNNNTLHFTITPKIIHDMIQLQNCPILLPDFLLDCRFGNKLLNQNAINLVTN